VCVKFVTGCNNKQRKRRSGRPSRRSRPCGGRSFISSKNSPRVGFSIHGEEEEEEEEEEEANTIKKQNETQYTINNVYNRPY
jgi:hypothetical protein